MRPNLCRQSDRPHDLWTYRLFLALAVLSLSGCADEGYELASARQDQLRVRYGSGPRSPLPLGALEAAIREGRADPEMYCDLAPP